MKNLIVILVLSFFVTNLFGQDLRYNQSDTATYYYSKTDFQNIDTNSLWRFKIDTVSKLNEADSIYPIGKIDFWRAKSIDDGISMEVYNKLWTPHISFYIYKLSDSSYCKEISNHVRFFSSCVPPNVGGDMIVLGDFILLNTSVCLSCGRYDTGVDYCRPILNKIFINIDDDKITSIELLKSQIELYIKKE